MRAQAIVRAVRAGVPGRSRARALMAATAASALAALLALSACSTGASPATSPSSAAGTGVGTIADSPVANEPSNPVLPESSEAPQDGDPLAVITTTPANRAKSVNPVSPIAVSVAGGTLTSVVMRNASGKQVTGAMDADGASWHTTEVLGYGKTYTIEAEAANDAGVPTQASTRFTTLLPPSTSSVSLERIGGYALTDKATYGVGIVPIVRFDTPVTNRAAAERALSVTTTPHVDGSWYWADDQDVHWRPESFWPSGTKVTVSAEVYGVKLGQGLYGAADKSTSFTIGRTQITYAYDNAPKAVNKVVVKNAAGRTLRTMNTSMGEHGGVTVNGNYINFYTMGGTYTVLGHENPAIMSSASYGLPADSPQGYAPEKIYWSTKISTDGIYLHELDTTIWAQNHGDDVSHGCLNLDHANAVWFFQHSIVGDPVVIKAAKGAPKIAVWQGGDWSVPWSKWLAGSALH